MILRHLAWTLGIAAIASTLIVSISSIWLVKKGLSPINLLITQTRQVSAQNLIKRLDDSQQPQELMPLIRQINDLLDRLSVAYRQMESFNADVAHEDRKSTRLNSSHLVISYAVFCLKKKTITKQLQEQRLRRQPGPSPSRAAIENQYASRCIDRVPNTSPDSWYMTSFSRDLLTSVVV